MPIITISRGAKSGGITLATMVAERLGYRCLSREVIVESAKKYNIDEETLQADLENTPSLWQRLTKEHHRYVVFAKCALLDAAKSDGLVYHGFAGQLFLQDIRHVLKVRLEAPLDLRLAAVMKDRDIDTEAATRHIQEVDAKRQRWVKFLYDREWTDPSLYDLTINTANMSVETAREVVCTAASQPEYQATPESSQALLDASLECEVRAGLAADDKLHNQRLVVNASQGVVVVRGHVKSKEQRDAVEEMVSMVKGVREYNVYLSLLSDPLPKHHLGHED